MQSSSASLSSSWRCCDLRCEQDALRERNSKYQRVSQAGARHKSQIVTLIVADRPTSLPHPLRSPACQALPTCRAAASSTSSPAASSSWSWWMSSSWSALSHPSKCNVNFFVRAIAYVKTTTKRSMPDRVATTCHKLQHVAASVCCCCCC